jgi:hypothetical protein
MKAIVLVKSRASQKVGLASSNCVCIPTGVGDEPDRLRATADDEMNRVVAHDAV